LLLNFSSFRSFFMQRVKIATARNS